MSTLRLPPNLRVFIVILIILLGTALYQKAWPSLPHRSSEPLRMMSRDEPGPIQGIEVTLEQSKASPPTIATTVTNHNQRPVTFLSYGSPLDGLALQTGLFSITPAGASEPVELPIVMVQRVWPPPPDALITIAPGASESKEIVLAEPQVPVGKLGSEALVSLSGRWQAMWAAAKDAIDEQALDKIHHAASDAHTGTFSSNVQVSIR